MPTTSDAMITALNAFRADEADDNQSQLYEITRGFDALPDRERIVPAMFAMERFAKSSLGTPGPLVHSIESLGVVGYESLLIASVRRQPVELNVWMVDRILNSRLYPGHRRALVDLLREVSQHPKAPNGVVDLANRFLDNQARREAV